MRVCEASPAAFRIVGLRAGCSAAYLARTQPRGRTGELAGGDQEGFQTPQRTEADPFDLAKPAHRPHPPTNRRAAEGTTREPTTLKLTQPR